MTVMVVPGNEPPVSSVTVPPMLPPTTCAAAGRAGSVIIKMTATVPIPQPSTRAYRSVLMEDLPD